MRRLSLALLAAFALSPAACTTDDGYAVDLTITLGSGLVASTIHRLEVEVTGAQTLHGSYNLATPFADGEERLVIRPTAPSGDLFITVTAYRTDNTVVALGTSGSITLKPGATVAARVNLVGGGTPDLGAPNDLVKQNDFSNLPDLTTPDLTTPDLATPDLATPADLSALPDLLPAPDLVAIPDLVPLTDLASTVMVSVTPPSVTLAPDEQQQFTPLVTGAMNNAVTWSVMGNGCGIITIGGLYTAPPAPNANCLVIATSVENVQRKAVAPVVITAGPPVFVTVTPTAATLAPTETLQLAATVRHTLDQSINWTIQEGNAAGSITNQGLYTAPANPGTYHVIATSVADATKKATAVITVENTVKVSVTPLLITLIPGEQHPFTATVTGAVNKAVTWSTSGGMLAPFGGTVQYTALNPGNYSLIATHTNSMMTGNAVIRVVAAKNSTIAGTITHNGQGGRIYITATTPCCVVGGTSIPAPGQYIIRGVQLGGNTTITAWRDLGGYTRYDLAADPVASRSYMNVQGDIPGADLTLVDPMPQQPLGAPMLILTLGFDRSVYLHWDRLIQPNDPAMRYRVYAATSPNPGPNNYVAVRTVSGEAETSAIVSPLTNGNGYYFAVTAINNQGVEGPLSNQSAKVIVGPAVGNFVLSTRINLPGILPLGPLYVSASSLDKMSNFAARSAAPIDPTILSLTGVPAGTYTLATTLDRFGDGEIGPIDPNLSSDKTPPLVLMGNTPAPPITLPLTPALVRATSYHYFMGGQEGYSIDLNVDSNTSLPTRATLSTSPTTNHPIDLGLSPGGSYSNYSSNDSAAEWHTYLALGQSIPKPNDPYEFEIGYLDGTWQNTIAYLSDVINLPTLNSPADASQVANGRPTFTWTAPNPLPKSPNYHYSVSVWNHNNNNSVWYVELPAGTLTVPWGPQNALPAGTWDWSVTVFDSAGNRASSKSFTFTTP